MEIREILNRALQVCPDSLACAVCGFDGMIVESVASGEGAQTDEVGAEVAAFSREGSRILDSLSFGKMQECHLMGERLSVLVQRVNEEFFIILVLGTETYLGRARYALKSILPELSGEL